MAADQHTKPDITALRKLEASIQLDLLERAASSRVASAGGTPN